MEDPVVRIEPETNKENNSRVNNVVLALLTKSPQLCLNNAENERVRKRLGKSDRLTSKKIKLDETENLAQKPQTMASGHKSSNSNKPKTPNYNGNRRFDSHTPKPRLGVHYLDEDSDESSLSNQVLSGELWKPRDSSIRKDSSKSSKNVSQRTSLPEIVSQPSTSGEHFPIRPKDQRNFENKKRALSINKKSNSAATNSSFPSDLEDYSSGIQPTSKTLTKNSKKNSLPAKNQVFNSPNDSRSDGEVSNPNLTRNFRSPVNKRSSRNHPERNGTSSSGESTNTYALSRDDSFFPRPRLPLDRFRGQGSPPRRQNPPHHRRQANGRNDGIHSYFRNIVQSIPDVFDTEDESALEISRNSPLRHNQTRARPVDNRDVEENETRSRIFRNRQVNVGFSPDHQQHRRNNRGSRQNRDRQPRIRLNTPVEQVEATERVRQIQEDEDLARILQAEFDAEAENNVVLQINEEDSDDSSINDVFENNNFNGDGSRIGIDSTSSSEVEEVDVVGNGFYRGPNGFPNSYSPNRSNGFQHIGFATNNLPNLRSRGRRGRPRSSRANALFHLDDFFGWAVGVNLLAEAEDNSSDDYEMLWSLTERLGEVIPRGMDKREINRLPTRKFSQASRNNNYQSDTGATSQTSTISSPVKECQVCLSEFENNEVLRILPCFHEFHAACIDRWLKNNNTCPVCRAEVNGANGE